jgi:hypothetical protein
MTDARGGGDPVVTDRTANADEAPDFLIAHRGRSSDSQALARAAAPGDVLQRRKTITDGRQPMKPQITRAAVLLGALCLGGLLWRRT